MHKVDGVVGDDRAGDDEPGDVAWDKGGGKPGDLVNKG